MGPTSRHNKTFTTHVLSNLDLERQGIKVEDEEANDSNAQWIFVGKKRAMRNIGLNHFKEE